MKEATSKLLQNRSGLVIRAAVALALCYAFASRAIDTGSIWQYGVAILFLVFGIKFTVQSIRK
jgi:hypothetical protein